MTSQGWRLGIMCSRSQINLDILLNCGQSFRWKRKNDAEWIGVIQDHVWRLRQIESGILYIVHGDQPMMKKCINNLTGKKHSWREVKPLVGCDDGESGDGILSSVKTEPGEETFKQELNSLNDVAKVNKNKKGHRTNKRASRKRSAIKAEEADSVVPCKLEKSEIDAFEHDVNSIKSPCHLPSALLNNGIMKIESLKEIYLREDMQYTGDNEHLHSSEHCEDVLRDYFQADINLCDLYDHWSSRDSHFKDVAAKFEGIRMLRQDPTENLLSFVCSSNNHISRISSMVEKLCVQYGTFITEVDGEGYYSFPIMSALTGDDVDAHLRQLGFGYRAKFISAIAKYIAREKDEGWLQSLRDNCSYKEAKSELIKLMGVGAKVADCVCLMSLDKPEAVPVDTHVWQITLKNYMAKLQNAKSLTEKIYNEIGDFYRDLWGPYAGWAHSVERGKRLARTRHIEEMVLFTADLKHNKPKESSKKSLEKEESQKTKTAAKSRKMKKK